VVLAPSALVLGLLIPLALAGCGSGGGGGGGGVKPVVQSLDEWMGTWRADVRTGARPNQFDIPVPPAVTELPTAADEIGRSVDSSAASFSEQVAEFSYAETKRVFCHWYGWYLETGATVPSEQEFPEVLLRYGFNRVFTSPPSVRLRSGIESFRNAIERGQNLLDDLAYASIAAACA
jgi:hypothetical protein